jgi:hypothetical protein
MASPKATAPAAATYRLMEKKVYGQEEYGQKIF